MGKVRINLKCYSKFLGLLHALPIILEPLSWMVGRWETQVRFNDIIDFTLI